MVAVLVGGASLIALGGTLLRMIRPKPMITRRPALSPFTDYEACAYPECGCDFDEVCHAAIIDGPPLMVEAAPMRPVGIPIYTDDLVARFGPITNSKIVIDPKRRYAYSVPIEADRADGRWSLMRTDAKGHRSHVGPHYSRRSTALRACRRANAAEALKHFRPSGEG